jgi:hypothetical protein
LRKKSTDYTYKFLVNDRYDTCLSPRHLKIKFQRLLKKVFLLAPNPKTLWGTLYMTTNCM